MRMEDGLIKWTKCPEGGGAVSKSLCAIGNSSLCQQFRQLFHFDTDWQMEVNIGLPKCKKTGFKRSGIETPETIDQWDEGTWPVKQKDNDKNKGKGI